MRGSRSSASHVLPIAVLTDAERVRATDYARMVLQHIDLDSAEAATFVRWSHRYRTQLQLVIPDFDDEEASERVRRYNRGDTPTLKERQAVQAAFSAIQVPPSEPDGLVGVLAKEFGFDSFDQRLLCLLLDYGRNNVVERLWDAARRSG